MQNQELAIPSEPVMMICNRNYRLASLSGWVVNFKADVPVSVHPFAYEEAIAIGAVPYEEPPEMVTELPSPESVVHESVAQAAELEAEAQVAEIERAIVKLFEIGDMTAFRADNYPKAAAVLALIPGNVAKPNAGDIQRVFDDMRDDVKYADLMGG